MPPPRGPPLATACYDGELDVVKRLLASGADPLERVAPYRGTHNWDGCLPIHFCCLYAHTGCLRALLALGRLDMLDERSPYTSATPLMMLCQRAGNPRPPQAAASSREREFLSSIRQGTSDRVAILMRAMLMRRRRDPNVDTMECVRLLVEAGASLEPTLTREQDDPWEGDPGDDALDIARRAENDELVRVLEDAARLRYSIARHCRFPLPARYAAAELLRLGYQIGSGILVPVWAEHVLPLLVSRTSRGAVPSLPRHVLFIDAISDSQVAAMLGGKYAAHATLELQRRADAAADSFAVDPDARTYPGKKKQAKADAKKRAARKKKADARRREQAEREAAALQWRPRAPTRQFDSDDDAATV